VPRDPARRFGNDGMRLADHAPFGAWLNVPQPGTVAPECG
jgi:hypothetical protein